MKKLGQGLMECWDWRKMRFSHYRGYSGSHSKKIARECDEWQRLSQKSVFEPPGPNAVEVRGSINFNRKGGLIRYSLPARQPRIFRGHK